MSEIYDTPPIDNTEKAIEKADDTTSKAAETTESAEGANLKESFGEKTETKENEDGTVAEDVGYSKALGQPNMTLEEVQALQKEHGIETHSLNEWDGDNVPNKPYIDKDSINNPEIEFADGFNKDTFNQDINKADAMAYGLSEDFVNNENVFDADTGKIDYPENEGEVKGSEKTYESLDQFKNDYDGDTLITRRGSHDGEYFGVGDISYEESSLAQEKEYFDETTCQYEIESIPDDCVIQTGEISEWEDAGVDRDGGGEQLRFAKIDEDGKTIGEYYSVSELEYEGHIKRVNRDDD
jgi:hypothetical protein